MNSANLYTVKNSKLLQPLLVVNVVILILVIKLIINQSSKLTTYYILWDWFNELAIFSLRLREKSGAPEVI